MRHILSLIFALFVGWTPPAMASEATTTAIKIGAQPSFDRSAPFELAMLEGVKRQLVSLGRNAPLSANLTTGVLPSWLSYASAGIRYYFDASGNLQTSPNSLIYPSKNWAATVTPTSSTVGVTQNAGIAPDGSNSSMAILSASGLVSQQLYELFAGQPNYSYVFSVYLKANGYNYAGVSLENTAFNTNQAVYFNLSSGVVTSQSQNATGTIVSVGGGWYRVSVFNIANGTGGNYVANIHLSKTGSDGGYFVGDGTSGILAWGQNVSLVTANQTTPSPFMPTSGSAYFGPAFDHNPSTLAALGGQSFPQRTNLFLNSLSPAGQTIPVASGLAYTISFYGTGTLTYTGACTGTLTGTSATTLTQATCTAATTSLVIASVTGSVTYPVVELGAFAGPRILTYGAAVTVPADNWALAGPAVNAAKIGTVVVQKTSAATGLTTRVTYPPNTFSWPASSWVQAIAIYPPGTNPSVINRPLTPGGP